MTKKKQHLPEPEQGGGAVERPRHPFSFKKYNAVVQSAELVDIRLTSSKFNVKTEYFLLKRAEKDENKNIMRLLLHGILSEARYDEEDGLIIGKFEWCASSSKGRKKLLDVRSTYLVVYAAAKDLEDEYVESFLDNVGRFATFPYFRSLVAGYSAASFAELPLLPVLKQPIRSTPENEISKAEQQGE